MPRKPRPLDRDSGVVRDASLIVIASEDTHAVHQYFNRFRPRRVQFRVLPSDHGHSAPEHILRRLDAFRDEFFLAEDDQLWYCGDTDHWATGGHLPNLLQVIQRCRKAGYHVALSHPCFELWLLLHFAELPPDAETCAKVVAHLIIAAGGYSKVGGCVGPITAEMVQGAVVRASRLDLNTPDIPTSPTTRVYQILQLLISRESIQLT